MRAKTNGKTTRSSLIPDYGTRITAHVLQDQSSWDLRRLWLLSGRNRDFCIHKKKETNSRYMMMTMIRIVRMVLMMIIMMMMMDDEAKRA